MADFIVRKCSACSAEGAWREKDGCDACGGTGVAVDLPFTEDALNALRVTNTILREEIDALNMAVERKQETIYRLGQKVNDLREKLGEGE